GNLYPYTMRSLTCDTLAWSLSLQSGRRLYFCQSRPARQTTVLAYCRDGRPHPTRCCPSGNPETGWLAYAASYVWNFVEEPRSGRENHAGAYEACERQHHA